LLWGTEAKKTEFIFEFYDIDRDGFLEANDIMEAQGNISRNSTIGEEMDIINEHYLNTRIKSALKWDKEKINL